MNDSTQVKTVRFRVTDALLLALTLLPVVFMITLNVLFTPESNGIEIEGALIYFTIPMPLQDLIISESQIHSWCVMVSLLFFSLYLTHGIAEKPCTRRQYLAEWMVEQTDKLVKGNMGPFFKGFSPFVGAILGLSAFSSLLALFGLYAPTSDINIVGGWALLVFILITYYKFKCGPVHYIAGFFDPPLRAPLNVISEFATPVSMAFRHYGNVLSGSVISVLLAVALQGLSDILLGWLPGVLSGFPLFRIGIPAVLSIYFDVFSGCLQAFIFAMLTMLYVSGGFSYDEYMRRKAKRAAKKREKTA